MAARALVFADATTLSVACAHEQDCWIATGARDAWHWTGEHFTALAPTDRTVLAVARDSLGTIYAIERDTDDLTALRIARLDGDTSWTTLKPAALVAEQHREFRVRAVRGTGRAVARPTRTRGRCPGDPTIADRRARDRQGHHGIKDDAPAANLSDADVRGPTAWLATASGVARISGGRLTRWTERDGLRSELVRAVSVSPSGDAVVGTRAGAGVWDGKMWTVPPALRFEVNDLVATRTGLWLASERGLVAWDGKNLRRFDTLRGLAENEVLDVAADQYGRIWARGPTSLTLVSQ